MPRRNDPPPTKTIIVYRNGDAFFPGRKVVLNPRQVSTFDSVLTSLTRTIEAPFGAVRRLYTPRQGRKVQQLDGLKHGSVYVAAGNEPFKNLDYCEITTKKPQSKKKEQIRPVVHSRILVSARWSRTNDESCTINVFTNGEILVPPARVRIPKYTLRSWENVLAMVTEKVRLRTGAVHRLFTIDGGPVYSSAGLKNNQHYVAVGAEKFKALPYDQCIPSRDLMRGNNTSECQNILPTVTKTRNAKDVFAHAGFREEDLEHTARGQIKKHTVKPERTKQLRQVSRNPVLFSTGGPSSTRFLSNDTRKVVLSACPLNASEPLHAPPPPEGSVFNAQNRRSEMAGAAEVQEDRQLKVDLPIDQVEAKIVDEEYVNGSCFASPYKASLHDLDGPGLQGSLSARSRTDEAKEREVSSRLDGIRSRMSRFFKEKMKH